MPALLSLNCNPEHSEGPLNNRIMETIIGLLFILLPLIFKLIGKRLEQSGSQDAARKIREIAQALDGEDSPVHDWKYFGQEVLGMGTEDTEAEEEAPVQSAAPVSAPIVPVHETEGKPAVVRKSLLKEDEEKKREKIDLKKMIIYSEIMSPKCNE